MRVDGEIAPAYTYVFNWRRHLRRGRQLEYVSEHCYLYESQQSGCALHYVPRTKEWWVSQKEEDVTQYRDFGYLRVQVDDDADDADGNPRTPPFTTPASTRWRLWIGRQWKPGHTEVQAVSYTHLTLPTKRIV